jgi:hypothetical protein
MTYGFQPENWSAFQYELRVRGIAVTDIEKVELRPQATEGGGVSAEIMNVTITLRSGRVDMWTQQQAEAITLSNEPPKRLT